MCKWVAGWLDEWVDGWTDVNAGEKEVPPLTEKLVQGFFFNPFALQPEALLYKCLITLSGDDGKSRGTRF